MDAGSIALSVIGVLLIVGGIFWGKRDAIDHNLASGVRIMKHFLAKKDTPDDQ